MLNRIAHKTSKAPLIRATLITAAAICTLGLTTALADYNNPITGNDLGHGQVCSPEISNWLFGVPVVAMLGAEAMRRKSAKSARKPLDDTPA